MYISYCQKHRLSYVEEDNNVVVGAKKASLSKIFGGRATRKVDTILEITMGAFWPTFHSIMKNATTNAMVYFLGK